MANNTAELKKFAQAARRQLREQVASRLEQVLGTDSAELRQQAGAIHELRQQIVESSKKAVIDRVAFTWFNRFCALRFMDVIRYNRIGVVSPAEGYTLPEILQEAKQGYIDDDLANLVNRSVVFDLLSGKAPSRDPQQEAYRLLLVGMCNALSKTMPFLFEAINDYTELLMPPDLLSENSILNELRKVMTPEACQDVEIIGWLYQYYISERKDEVFEALKKNQKIEAEDIPAATQLFTPHWIVRYLVENSLGRLWMLNHPTSKLVEQMEYYIRPVEEETDFLRINSPEEIKVCDPACGSGHMLTYAFDLLHAIYEEEGYPAVEIPRLILKNNLYGVEIDERAGTLAAFALVMKARAKDRRFLSRETQPNICVLEDIHFNDQELKEYINATGRNLFTEPLLETLKQFEQASNFGSLIRPNHADAGFIRQMVEANHKASNLFLHEVHQRVIKALVQAEYLSPRYHVVVANPPYMSGSGMNEELKTYLFDNFPEVKSDLFSAFIIRNLILALPKGQLGYMSPFVWMFISSYEKLRYFIINHKNITSLVQLEYSGFDGAVVPICTFTIENSSRPDYIGAYIRLSDFRGAENQAPKTLEAIHNPACGWFYHANAADFKKIPGAPITYWVSENARKPFEKGPFLGDIATTRVGMATGDNDRFVRIWSEVEIRKIGFSLTRDEAMKSDKKWFPYSNGGEAKKWFANYLDVVNWENDGYLLQTEKHETGRIRAHNFNLDKIFLSGLTWSLINSSYNAIRVLPKGFLFSSGAPSLFPHFEEDTDVINGYYNSSVSQYYLRAINPTLNNNSGDADKLPFSFTEQQKNKSRTIVKKLVSIAKNDWDAFEISWDFIESPLLLQQNHNNGIALSYSSLRDGWQALTNEMQHLETENNRTFIEAYSLYGDIEPDVQIEKITLACNPRYRYSGKKSEDELEFLLLADTMREFISYSVGCMFGRYSLDKSGLILANQGETLQDYLRQVPEPTFLPDDDNVIPILDGEWFNDDITERFKKFLHVTFGNEQYEENLAFIEEAIGRDIRSYFVKDFYAYHVKMYQKRPIYWLFSSPKGSFNVLIYMHRYNRDTLSVILNKYLRPFQSKLEARKSYLEQLSISGSASPREKTAALKEIEKLTVTLEELRVYERDILYPLAAQRIEIDLDDGVKVNYAKFGQALAKVPGLNS